MDALGVDVSSAVAEPVVQCEPSWVLGGPAVDLVEQAGSGPELDGRLHIIPPALQPRRPVAGEAVQRACLPHVLQDPAQPLGVDTGDVVDEEGELQEHVCIA